MTDTSYLWSIAFPILVGLYILLIASVFFKILLENRNPLKTQSYLILLVLLPVGGLIIYFFFGVSYRKEKLFSRKKIFENNLIKKWMDEYVSLFKRHEAVLAEVFEEKIKIPKLLFETEKAITSARNDIRVLKNGEEKFQSLLEDLKEAKHHIHIEYYIIIDDTIGNDIFDILKEKAKKGLEVRLIYDDVGSIGLSKKAIRSLESAGVEVGAYMPVLLPRFANKVNYRNHRKIVVIDGTIGYTGGINVEDKYINAPGRGYWRDTHMRIFGDAVKSLQLLFLLDWYFVKEHLIEPSDIYFPECDLDRFQMCSIIGSGPDSDTQSMMELYFSLITNTREEILITTPYFIPNESILTAIITAAKSGVKVKMLLPKNADSVFIHEATLSFLKPVIKSGAEVYLYEKGMIHAKTIVVDGRVSTVGTANLDYRSFEQNSEVNAVIYDEKVARRLKKDFEEDLENAFLIDLKWLKKRGLLNRFIGSFARLFAPLL